mmetsp:Transcript_37516/g.74455  ORF Transcript_37516/g.74455 Transcript_37516/m.74455 type:complete len:592 (+) Transcript_37516:53-1828(+)
MVEGVASTSLRIAGGERPGRSLDRDRSAGARRIQCLEERVEQLLQQMAFSLRKEQTEAVCELRRDMVMQVSTDIAAHENRLLRQLDERPSVKSEECFVEIAELRNTVGESRHALEGIQRDVARLTMDLAEVARAERCLSEDLTMQVSSMESACQEAGRCVSLLHEDLAHERTERCASFADMNCRIEKQLREGRKQSMTTAASGKGSLNSSGSQDTGRVVNAEYTALAACLGEMDAELRMEMGKRLTQVLADVRSEMAAGVKALEAELRNFASQSVARLDNRIGFLEAARLDLRLGALETAWQHASPFMVTRPESVPNSPCVPAVATGSTAPVGTPRGDRYVQHNNSVLSATDLAEQGCSTNAHPCQTRLRVQPSGGPAPALEPCKYHQEQPCMSSETPPLQPADRLSPPEEENKACQPLISEDLKGRLETLVLQVKSTLSRAHSEGQPLQAAQGSASDGSSAASKLASLSPNQSDMTRKQRRHTAADSCRSPAPVTVPNSPGHVQSQMLVPHQVLRSMSISAPRRTLRSQSPLRQSVGASAALTATPNTARSLAASSSAFSVVAAAPHRLWVEGCATSPVPTSPQSRGGSW